jgi:hypothetical protein
MPCGISTIYIVTVNIIPLSNEFAGTLPEVIMKVEVNMTLYHYF